MEPREIVFNIALGVAANGATALLGWMLKAVFAPDTMPTQQDHQATSLAETVDRYIEQKRLIEAQRQVIYRVEQKVTIETHSTSNDSDEMIGAAFGLLMLVAFLAYIWKTYNTVLFFGTLACCAIGWATSFYFIHALFSLNGPYRLEDIFLSVFSMFVWFLGVFGLYLGVFQPLYSIATTQDDLSHMFAQAIQVIGAMGIYVAMLVTAFLQYVAGSVYHKGVRGKLPNQFEVMVWENRWIMIILLVFALFGGFIMVSGIFSLLTAQWAS